MKEIPLQKRGRQSRDHFSVSIYDYGDRVRAFLNLPNGMRGYVHFYEPDETSFQFRVDGNPENGHKITTGSHTYIPKVLVDAINFRPGTHRIEVTPGDDAMYVVEISQFA